MEDWKNAAPPGGETLEGLECRVRAWWYSLLETSAHRLIGHAGVLRTLRVLTKKVPWDDAIAGRVEHLRWAAYPLFYESSSSRLFG